MEPSAAMNEWKKAAVRVLASSLTDSLTTKASKVLFSIYGDMMLCHLVDVIHMVPHRFRHGKQFETVSHVTSRVLLKEPAASSLWAGRMALQATSLDPSEMAHQ